ncbi:MAG: DUF3160 domain-containing protein [Clostridiales bacterium]|nr:DUF3160 domain-containing protein [Clostridiales bacterium]
MKKLIAITLCVCILLAGCSSKKEAEQDSSTIGKENSIDSEDKDKSIGKDKQGDNLGDESDDTSRDKDDKLINLRLNKEWAAVTLTGVSQPDYNNPIFEAKVNPYVINEDLSNIENIDQFSGFTDEQKEMLVKNGFVVLPSEDTRMNYVYDSNEYLGIPNFITTDSVLHLYHQFYDKSLMGIESNFMYDDLDNLTRQMLAKSIRLWEVLEDEELKVLQERNIIYFLVARMLMLESSEVDISGVDVKEELYNIAKEEYQLIDKAEGFIKSPYLAYDFDYSQFTIRGHYTRSDKLGRFFKTMMWFGTAAFSFNDLNNIYQSLLISYTTFLDTDYICDAQLWNNIYQPTEQYVGVSDDINVFMMNGLRLDVFGETDDPNIFNDEEYKEKLQEAVKDLPEPRIQGKFIGLTTPTEKQFRYMGQRYILDSFIMQELMESILRPLPSALDPMGVMGSSFAEDLLFNYYKPQEAWPDYEENYNKLKEEVSGYGVDTWGDNLYNGWLWSIKENLTEYDNDSGMPYFMTNDAWKAKSLNASLGSYTELKHDTVLYGKQSVAEGGGGIDYEQADYHYVEPNVYLYSKLLYLTEYTLSVLKERDMLNWGLEDGATDYQKLLKLLIDYSIKELQNEKITEEEYDQLLYYGAKMEGISNSFLYALDRDDSDGQIPKDLTDMLVTDVATNPGAYLSLGTGYFDHIFVVVPVEGKLYLSRGSVYSHYEFISDTRLTDEQWWELNGVKVNREEYGEYAIRTEPSEYLPKQAEWVKLFKSDENNVSIERIEVDWELLLE